MLPELPSPAIFAHRGASAYAPENTLAAFELAIRQGAHAIELDTKLTADGHVVVIHDLTVDRTTEGSGRVSDLALVELQELDAGYHYDETFRGERIPALEQVFETIGKKILVNIEIANYGSPLDDLPTKICGLVKKHELAKQVLFSSFNPLALRRAHQLLPEIPLGLLAHSGFVGVLARSSIGRWVPYQALHPHKDNVTLPLIKRLKKRGQRVHAYTVNLVDDMLRLFNWGIDGIFTDDPPLALSVLEEI
jgi:glycerophosphoryl diester phosphodiesterase